jgi:nitrogen fixation/metabolism regulation signal transduction histidine kinase
MAAAANRRGVVVVTLGVCLLALFLALATLNAFNLNFLNPASPLQTLIFIGLSVVAFLLFVGVLVLLVRNVLKLYADQRSRVLGTRLRTRMLWGAVLVSIVPLVFMFAFSYLLMNRAVDRWFSQPVTQMREDANRMAQELFRYAAANARSEAGSIAVELGELPLGGDGSPTSPRKNAGRDRAPGVAAGEKQIPFGNDNKKRNGKGHGNGDGNGGGTGAAELAAANRLLERHQLPLQGGFAVVYRDGQPVLSMHLPQTAPGGSVVTSLQPPEADDDEAPANRPAVVTTRLKGPLEQTILQAAQRNDDPFYTLGGADYTLATAGLPQGGLVVVGLPIPPGISATSLRLRQSADAYWTLFRERRQIRNLYMFLLLLTTSLALFACCWLALNLSKQVTRPVESLADAMEAIAGGDYAHRVAQSATEELGELVESFNAMAADLESAHELAERSAVQLSGLNEALQARRTELVDPGGQRRFIGLDLEAVLPAEIAEPLDNLLRRAHRMGSAAGEMQMRSRTAGGGQLELSATVALLEGGAAGSREGVAREHLGYVLVLEDATELLRAQKQSAWKEVARRVAHEIKNPLTPIALNAELTQRHVGRLMRLLAEHGIESPSPAVIQRSSEVISSSVQTMRSLVDQFSTLAEFPAARPQPADLNAIVEAALALFSGRLGSIRVRLDLARDLPPVLADPEALKRALSNLIDNAAEAMQNSLLRELQIATRLLPAGPGAVGMLELTVADTGPGLTDEMRERLFLPYFSTKQRGTGLGLSIAAKILQEHQGSIRAEKNLPAGAKFILELRPAAADGAEAQVVTAVEVASEVAS